MIPATARAPLLTGAGVIVGFVYVGLVDPNEPGHYLTCPTKALTGLDCAFCGGLRAAHSLARADVLGAADHNLLVVLLAVPVLLLWLAWLRRAWTGDPDGRVAHPLQALSAAILRPSVLWPVAGVLFAFMVVRNLDVVPALAWLGSSAPA